MQIVNQYGKPFDALDWVVGCCNLQWHHGMSGKNYSVYSEDGHALFGQYHPDRGPITRFKAPDWKATP